MKDEKEKEKAKEEEKADEKKTPNHLEKFQSWQKDNPLDLGITVSSGLRREYMETLTVSGPRRQALESTRASSQLRSQIH